MLTHCWNSYPGTYCAPLVADLFIFCYEKDFIMSLSNQQAKTVFFISTSRYLNEALNVDNPYFESLFNQTYPPE